MSKDYTSFFIYISLMRRP